VAEASDSRFRLFTPGAWRGGAYFYVGRTADGRAVLAGPCRNGLQAVWFDADGRLAGVDEVPFASSARSLAGGGSPDAEGWADEVVRWLDGVGFRPEPLEVRPFHVTAPEYVCVRRYPAWAEDYLADPDLTEPGERPRLAAKVARWDEQGRYVVLWGGGTYHLDRDGGYSS
jgi:hypothetical protein